MASRARKIKTIKYPGLIMLLLLSLCNGFANGARGSGIKGGKVVVVLMMILSSFAITHSYYSILFPIPLLLSWWVPGGTGGYMREVIGAMSFLNWNEGQKWRFFEIMVVFLYCMICGIIYLV